MLSYEEKVTRANHLLNQWNDLNSGCSTTELKELRTLLNDLKQEVSNQIDLRDAEECDVLIEDPFN